MNTMILDGEMIAAFGRELYAGEKSPHTIEKYLRDARAFQRFASGLPLTKELVVDYKRHLAESGKYADSSINSILASLRGLFKFLLREDCGVESIRTQETPYCPENRSLTMKEYRRLLEAAEEDRRLQMLIKILTGTGIRISELEFFTVEALRKKGGKTGVRVICKKKSREILIPDELRRELLIYIDERGIEKGAIFRTESGNPMDRSNIWRQLKRLCRKACVDEEKVFPHNFRKLFARTFYEQTHDLAQLACLLGHSSINTTMIYVKRTEQEVRAKVDRMIKIILHQTGSMESKDPESRKSKKRPLKGRNSKKRNKRRKNPGHK